MSLFIVEQNEHRILTVANLETFIVDDVIGFESVLREIEKILLLIIFYKKLILHIAGYQLIMHKITNIPGRV